MTEPEAPYNATSVHNEFSDRWRVYWQDYLDGRFLVAEERFTDHPAVFARKTPEALGDVLREHEAARKASR